MKLRTLKIWLDDERPVPNESWTLCKTSKEVIEYLEKGGVLAVDLDHDLGSPIDHGYRVLEWIEQMIHMDRDYIPPIIRIHTQNPVALQRMRKAREAILNAAEKRQ